MKMKKGNSSIKQSFPYLILAVVIIGTLLFFNYSRFTVHDLTTGELLAEVRKGTITELKITPKASESGYIIEGKLEGYKETESFRSFILGTDIELVTTYALENKLDPYEQVKDPGSSAFMAIMFNTLLPLLLFGGFIFFIFTRMHAGGNKSLDFGRSRAKLSDSNAKLKFTDVAGLKEEKEEVEELIDFLKHPRKFQNLGARIPKGVLLVGPPGTGKTLLAKAVAGEANVPFFYISGSDFVELFVGVGASRVRDMFKQAKQSAPCLIFIDEIDAVGRQRGTGLGGGHDEREQTLNQLLTEMDGFGANEGIIIIAATNRPDVLDPALLRPGRFDRQVTVSLPDSKEREAILNVHARGKTFGKDVNLGNISLRTPGFSGADLENLLNEAALLAVRRDKTQITMDEIDEATDRVLLGPAKTSRKITDKERNLVAIHEAGHAVIGLKLEDANVVHKITIIPRGMAGGYTMMLPKEEKIGIMTKNELLANITGLMGGRVCEELFFGEITTGASDDFRRATNIARSMVTEYGMSDLGPMQLEQKSGNVFLGRDYTSSQKNFSDQVALEIDKEVRKIIEECYDKAKIILKKHEKLVKTISDALLKHETLTKEDIEELVKTGKIYSGSEEASKIKTVSKPSEETPKKKTVSKAKPKTKKAENIE